jgi:hypothetical protein
MTITPADDYFHPRPPEEPYWNEAGWFSFNAAQAARAAPTVPLLAYVEKTGSDTRAEPGALGRARAERGEDTITRA